ncbi:MFS transporter [Yersinia pestis]|uniref:ExuT transport protein n=17 Tax=Yersinia pseudotuberculosis complex TaxID=1649845 RepID=A0A380PLZ1_YERPE|nr:transport of hexuronates [Yersinia pestis KIM10+]AAS63079.1 ExuT transport protein [Yersinia pestis biovar Microtus str. 91001]ABG15173.1 ExuT transport protein [Yersinia pestis Antiqua]ABG16778.1 ExuT transport protein [Yersinia pestis Nepal516]ABX85171.1 putative hexuronate MFS transporter ExuT [Yersinia pestis Angola]ACY57415.1 ExuT transport protein [Yersinia pestis D106004]ACY61198.1 ExuT transport protein [Yersinia pestis D182038]ADE63464.1 ExuT transport protein [Yersinia pestis Z1
MMRKIKGLRWYMIALVTVGTILGYLTRNAIAVAAPTLQEQLHITTQQYSYIIAAYSAAYTLMQPVAGYVLDVMGTKVGYAMFAVMWAIFCMSTALASSWGGLAIARGAVGMAEAAMIPAGLKASSEWFPAKERSIAVGYFNVGSSIGGMIAPPLVVWAIVMHSWQMAFIITGVLSLIWAIAWLILYKHPKDQKRLSDEEREYILSGQEAQHSTANAKKMSAMQIIRNRQFWGIAIPRFLAEPAWGTFNAWIPLFMFKAYGFNLKEIAMFAWMPMLFADVGCILGGYLPPLFQKYFKVNLIVSRKLVVTMGGVLMIGPGTIGLFTSPYAAIALLCIGGFAHQALSGALITLSSDVFGRNEVATANGLTGMAAWTASTLFALVVGALADTMGFSPLFAALAVFDLLAVVVIWTVLQDRTADEPTNDPVQRPPVGQN